jgi:hypothetical protein
MVAFSDLDCLEWVGFSKSHRQSGPDRAVSNDLLTSPWVRTVAAYAGVATVSPTGLLQAQNGAAGHIETSCGSGRIGSKRVAVNGTRPCPICF